MFWHRHLEDARFTIGFVCGLLALVAACSGAETGVDRSNESVTRNGAETEERHSEVTWLTWEDARCEAMRQGAPIMVLLYTDWCPRCTELKHYMETDEFAAATEGLILVRHDVDQPMPWSPELFADRGSYVPRIFFLSPSGELAPELVSNNRRFPHFFSATQGQVLTHTMALAVQRLSEPVDVSAVSQ